LARCTISNSSRQREITRRELDEGLSGCGISTTSDRMSRLLDIESPIRRAADHLEELDAVAEDLQTQE